MHGSVPAGIAPSILVMILTGANVVMSGWQD
jgi:hypothetical protein